MKEHSAMANAYPCDCEDAAPMLDEELELSAEQVDRNDEMYNAVYELCKLFTEDDDLEWNMSYIGEITDLAASIMVQHGKRVRYPAVVTEPDGTQYIEEYYEIS